MKNLALLFAMAALISVAPKSARAGHIRMQGQDSLVTLARQWAEHYMVANPRTKIHVTSAAAVSGIAALQNKSADLWVGSRKMKAQELADCVTAFGARPTEYKVAL